MFLTPTKRFHASVCLDLTYCTTTAVLIMGPSDPVAGAPTTAPLYLGGRNQHEPVICSIATLMGGYQVWNSFTHWCITVTGVTMITGPAKRKAELKHPRYQSESRLAAGSWSCYCLTVGMSSHCNSKLLLPHKPQTYRRSVRWDECARRLIGK